MPPEKRSKVSLWQTFTVGTGFCEALRRIRGGSGVLAAAFMGGAMFVSVGLPTGFRAPVVQPK